MADSTGLIIVSGLVAGGSTLLADVSKGSVTIKPVIAGFLIVSGLLFVSTFNEDIAKGFAILIMATALVRNGSVLASVIEHLGNVTSAPTGIHTTSTQTI